MKLAIIVTVSVLHMAHAMPIPMVIILFYPKHVQFGEEIRQFMLVIFCEALKQDSICSKGFSPTFERF